MGKAEEINRAVKEQPRAGHHAPAKGGPGESGLGSAVSELHKQHPIKYDSLGPHHGKSYHDRHESLGGMHPKSRHGR
jgi:hypothetical protein